MILTWTKPATPNGYIQNYTIYDITRNNQIATNGSVLEQKIMEDDRFQLFTKAHIAIGQVRKTAINHSK
jgi:hypothetical protein